MPPWAAFEWERTGWTLERIPTETPSSAAASAARCPASRAQIRGTSCGGKARASLWDGFREPRPGSVVVEDRAGCHSSVERRARGPRQHEREPLGLLLERVVDDSDLHEQPGHAGLERERAADRREVLL